MNPRGGGGPNGSSRNSTGGGGGGGRPPDRSMGDQFRMSRSGGNGGGVRDRGGSGGGGGGGSGSGGSGGGYYSGRDTSYHRRGGGGGGGRDDRRGGGVPNTATTRQQQIRSRLPLEHGVIRTLKESFGFISPVDRPDDVFFHCSEYLGGGDGDTTGGGLSSAFAEAKVGDAVEFKVVQSSSSSSSGGGGSSGTSGRDDSGGANKLAAVDVRRCDPKHIQWEIPMKQRVRGLVERGVSSAAPQRQSSSFSSSSSSQHGSSSGEGWIRVLVENEEDTMEQTADRSAVSSATTADDNASQGIPPPKPSTSAEAAADKYESKSKKDGEGPVLCKFTFRDCVGLPASVSPSPNSGGSNSNNRLTRLFGGSGTGSGTPSSSSQLLLSRGDLVEFDLVMFRRTKEYQARNVTLIRSEQQRLHEEREKRLLETAVEEEGVVTSLKGEYGFIRSNKRREEVYFHYSSVELGDGGDGEGDREGAAVLQEGQELKFLVVSHGNASVSSPDAPPGGGGRRGGSGASSARQRVSARRVSLQPRGSVKFHDALACGVTGVVIQCPQPVDAGHSLEARGRVQLTKPITLPPPATSSVDETFHSAPRIITEVYLASADSPGGTYAYRGGTSVATWVQVGDTLLFDVVRDYVDGACHAAPTIHLVPNPDPEEIETENPDDARKVRLIEISTVGRAQGVINAVKESYGFLHFAERPVDVHFKLYQVLPDELQADIRRNRGLADVDDKGQPLRLSVGTEAEFDISVHGTIHVTNNHASNKSSKKGGGNDRERENLKAQRVLFLPPKTVQISYVLARKARGTVAKTDAKQACSGMIELDEPVPPLSLEVRHPLVARMIDEYLKGDLQIPLVYHDVNSSREDDTVLEMIAHKQAQDLLYVTHIPQAGAIGYPGRLCIRKVGAGDRKDESNDAPTPVEDAPEVEAPSGGESEPPDGNDSVEENKDDRKNLEDAGTGDETSQDGKNKRRKTKKRTTAKLIRSVRYDKSNLPPEIRVGIPPVCGDVVELDVVQSRRTMQVTCENFTILERKNPDVFASSEASESGGVGVVSEIVPARNFGFISVLDETSTKREALFFSLSNVVGLVDVSKADKSMNRKVPLRKGDEVKFEVRSENGKRVAFNVAQLTKGSIPSQVEKDACRGIILLEPSKISLKTKNSNPPKHSSSIASTASSDHGSVSSRWDTASRDGNKKLSSSESLVEEGCILLLDDPGNMFGASSTSCEPSNHQAEQLPSTSKGEAIEGDSRGINGDGTLATEPKASVTNGEGTGSAHSEKAVGRESAFTSLAPGPRRVTYVIGSLAIHGHGAALGTDDALNPRRGDIVTFLRSKRYVDRARDVRLHARGAANLVRGRLEGIADGKANFITATDDEEVYEIDMTEIVGCDPSLVKDKESVEGVLHEGRMYGVARTADLYLESKVRVGGLKERPKLNLTVKKDRGGTIMAQSMMAKGPDGTIGFASGWTKRVSKFAGEGDSENRESAAGVEQGSMEKRRDNTPPPDDGDEPVLVQDA